MNGFSFNGRMSRKFSKCRGSEEREGNNHAPIPLMRERTMTQSGTNVGIKVS